MAAFCTNDRMRLLTFPGSNRKPIRGETYFGTSRKVKQVSLSHMKGPSFALTSLIILVLITGFDSSVAQIIVSDLEGNVRVESGQYFETGVRLLEGESISYSYKSESAESKISFDIHAHLINTVDTLVVKESYSETGTFVAPYDNDFYLLWINEGIDNANIQYSITPPSHNFEVEHLDQTFSFLISSNSEISKVKFVIEDKAIDLDIQTPFRIDGIIDIILPSELLAGDFLVQIDGTPSPFDLATDGETSHLSLQVGAGTHEIKINGTQGIPEFDGILIGVVMSSAFFVLLIARRRLRKNHVRT